MADEGVEADDGEELVIKLRKPKTSAPRSGLEQHQVRWIERMSKVWIPVVIAVITGFLAGMGTCTSAYFQRDVRNQVWQATFEDKERVLNAQSDLLKLQEDYLGKLKQVQEGEAALAKARDEVRAKELEAVALQQQSERALASMRARYARLEAAERTKIARTEADRSAQARREPWKNHGCFSDGIIGKANGQPCSLGYRVTFARDTPDMRVIVSPESICRKTWDWSDQPEYERCETYAKTFLAAKGLTPEDIKWILMNYRWRSTLTGFSLNDHRADEALKEKFKDSSKSGK